jgi:hypothetical protein
MLSLRMIWRVRRSVVSFAASVVCVAGAIAFEPHVPGVLASLGLKRWAFYQRTPDDASYDLLMAAISAIVGTLVLLYFTVGAAVLAIVAGESRRAATTTLYNSRWIIWPVTLECVAMELLGLAVFRERPAHAALPVVGVLSLMSLLAFSKLGRQLLAVILERPQSGGGPPAAPDSWTHAGVMQRLLAVLLVLGALGRVRD